MLSEERMELGMYGVLYFLERKKNVYLFRVFFFTYIKEIHNFILLLECLSSFSFIQKTNISDPEGVEKIEDSLSQKKNPKANKMLKTLHDFKYLKMNYPQINN